jgi:ankyrin repeat protein
MQVATLIQGAIFRSRQTPKNEGRLSLGIYSLGELVDMYHAHEATRFHDKIYALLGMCTDDLVLLRTAGLDPDYSLESNKLMEHLVKFILGNQVSVETWKDKEIAVIKSTGYVLGKVSKAKSDANSGSNTQSIEATVRNTSEERGHKVVRWTLQTTAKSTQPGDIIFSIPGVPKAIITRWCKDHFVIIMIAAVYPELMKWSEVVQSATVGRDFILFWNWKNSPEIVQQFYETWKRKDKLQSEHSEPEFEDRLKVITRRWRNVLILVDVEDWEKAEKELYEALREYGEEEHSYTQNAMIVKLLLKKEKRVVGSTSTVLHGLISYAAGYGHSAVVKLLLDVKVDPDVRDRVGRTALSQAASNGYEAIIRLLLEAKADPEVEDGIGRTPLLWAAGYGHSAVVKLLLETEAYTEVKDSLGRTPLLWAATCESSAGYSAVVELLLEAKADAEAKDRFGRTPLLSAAANGNEVVVKLLLELKANSETEDQFGRTSLSYAIENGHSAVAKLLLKAKTDTEVGDG